MCDIDLSNHGKLCDLDVKPVHNASRACWVDDKRITYYAGRSIHVVDVDSGEQLISPVAGDAAHATHIDRLPYWAEGAEAAGVRALDVSSGSTELITACDDIRSCLEPAIGPLGDFSVKHLQFSPDGNHIGFRSHGERTDMLTMRSDGSDLHLYPAPKPIHQLWYDNDCIVGVWIRGAPEGKDRHYFRWSLEAELLETLAGPISHGAASTDRQWHAGETCAYF